MNLLGSLEDKAAFGDDLSFHLAATLDSQIVTDLTEETLMEMFIRYNLSIPQVDGSILTPREMKDLLETASENTPI